MKKIIILALGLTLLAAACNKSTTTTNNGNGNTNNNNQNTTEVDITSNGFSPASITVKKGTVVKFVNKDATGHWPASDPHPSHTDLPGFDSSSPVVSGDSYSFTFDKVGTWGYHDHLHPGNRGIVTVTE